MSTLTQGSQKWNNRYLFFKDRICNSTSRNVYCCSEKAPDESFLETLKTPTTTTPRMTTTQTSTSPILVTTKVTTTITTTTITTTTTTTAMPTTSKIGDMVSLI